MSKEDEWVKELLTKTKANHPLATEPLVSRLTAELETQLCDQTLTKKELTTLAKELLDLMAPNSVQGESK